MPKYRWRQFLSNLGEFLSNYRILATVLPYSADCKIKFLEIKIELIIYYYYFNLLLFNLTYLKQWCSILCVSQDIMHRHWLYFNGKESISIFFSVAAFLYLMETLNVTSLLMSRNAHFEKYNQFVWDIYDMENYEKYYEYNPKELINVVIDARNHWYYPQKLINVSTDARFRW